MAVTGSQEFKVKVSADDQASGSLKNMNNAAKEAAKGFESLGGKMVIFEASLELVKKGTELVKKAFEMMVEPAKAAMEAETANVRLATSLKTAGQYSTEAMEGIEKFTESLRNQAGVSDEVIKKVIATNVAIGMTIPQAEEAAQAAAALAKFQGSDLVSANEELVGSLSGMDRGLRKVAPGVAALTLDQKRHGDAIKLVGKALQDFVNSDAQTTQGALTRLQLGWDELVKKVGFAILQGADIPGRFAEISKALDDLGTFIMDNRDAIVEFANSMVTTGVESIKTFTETLKDLGPVLVSLAAGFGRFIESALLPVAEAFVLVDKVIAKMSNDKALENHLDNLSAKIQSTFLKATLGQTAFKKASETPGATSVSNVKTSSAGGTAINLGNTGRVNLAMTQQQQQQQLQMQRSLDDQRLQIELSFGNSLVASHTLALNKIKQTEQDAATAGVSVHKQALALRIALDKQYEVEKMKGYFADRQAAAQGGTDDFKIAQTAYENRIVLFNEQLQKGNLTNAEFTANVQAAELARVNAYADAQLKIDNLIDDGFGQEKQTYNKQLNNLKDMLNQGLIAQHQYYDGVAAAQSALLEKSNLTQKLMIAGEASKKAYYSVKNTDYGAAAQGVSAGASKMLGGEFTDGAKVIGESTNNIKAAANDIYQAGAAIFSASSDMFTQVVGTFMTASQILIDNVLSGKWIQDATDIFEKLGNLPNQLVATISSLSAVLNGIVKTLPGALNNFLQKFPSFIDKIKDVLPKAMEMMGAMLPKIGKAMADTFPGLIKAVMTGLPSLIDGLMLAMHAIIDKLPDMLSAILKGLPNVIKHFISGLGEIAAELIDKIPAILESFADNIGPITESLVRGLLDAMPRIVVALANPQMWLKVAAAFVKALINALGGAVLGLLKGIGDIFTGKGFHIKMPEIKMPNVGDQMQRALDSIKGSSSDIFKVEDFKAATKSVDIGDKIRDAANSAAVNVSNVLSKIWRDLEVMLKAVWKWVWDTIIAPIETLLIKAWKWVWDNVLSPILGLVSKAFQWVIDNVLAPIGTFVSRAFQWVIDNVLIPLFSGIPRAFQWVVDNIIKPLASIGQAAFQWVSDNIVKPLSSIGLSAFQWVYDNVVKPLMAVASVFSNFKLPEFHWPSLPEFHWPDLPKPSWWSAGGFIKGEVHATGITHAAQNVGSAISSGFKRAFHADGGQVKNGLLYAADGTDVRGTDIVPAMLTPGEFVINRHAVSRVGLPTLDRINSGLSPGGGGLNITAPITINTTQPIDAAFIRSKLVPTLMDEIKRASQNGRYVLSTKGIRSV